MSIAGVGNHSFGNVRRILTPLPSSLDLTEPVVYAKAMATELNLSGLEESNRTYIQLLVNAGQKPRAETQLFGKPYLWFEDPDSGRWYLEQLRYEKTFSISATGEVEEVVR